MVVNDDVLQSALDILRRESKKAGLKPPVWSRDEIRVHLFVVYLVDPITDNIYEHLKDSNVIHELIVDNSNTRSIYTSIIPFKTELGADNFYSWCKLKGIKASSGRYEFVIPNSRFVNFVMDLFGIDDVDHLRGTDYSSGLLESDSEIKRISAILSYFGIKIDSKKPKAAIVNSRLQNLETVSGRFSIIRTNDNGSDNLTSRTRISLLLDELGYPKINVYMDHNNRHAFVFSDKNSLQEFLGKVEQNYNGEYEIKSLKTGSLYIQHNSKSGAAVPLGQILQIDLDDARMPL